MTNFFTRQEISISDYIAKNDNEAMLYVGTYKKYNSGSLFGEWISLEACGDLDTFMDVISVLHSDEDDPEFMFQDYQNIPESYYSESLCVEELERLFEYIALDDDDKELLDAFIEVTGNEDATIEDAKDRYCGQWDSDEDFAYYFYVECYPGVEDNPLFNYVDWSHVAREMMFDHVAANGFYFSR